MLKQIVSDILRSRAPYIFWALRLSRMRRDFGEEELHLAPPLCDKQKTSVDIGGARGDYTAHILYKSRDCLAFEPRPTEAAELKEMFGRLSLPVRVEAVALSDRQGEARLRILEQDGGRSTIESDNTLEDSDGSGRYEITVPTRQLDDYALEAVGFIKIDVEGHELAVLHGALETIRRCLPTLLIEIENRHKSNAVKEVCDLLEAIGYDGYFILDRRLISVSNFDLNVHQNPKNISGWKSGWKKSGVYVNNFIFVPSGLVPRLEAAVDKIKDRLSAHF